MELNRFSPNDLLRVETVAELCNVSPSTVYGWLQRRKIVGVKLIGTWRVRYREVDKILNPEDHRPVTLRDLKRRQKKQDLPPELARAIQRERTRKGAKHAG